MSLTAGLRTRLVLALLLVFALGAAAMALVARSEAVSASEVLEDTSLTTQARDLLRSLRFDPQGRLQPVSPPALWRRAYAAPAAAYYTLFDRRGRAVARSPNLPRPLSPIPLVDGQAFGPLRLVGPGQDLALAARAPLGHLLVVARSNPGRLHEVDPQPWQDRALDLLFFVIAVLMVLAAWFVAGWSLRPLSRAAQEAAGLGPDRPQARLSGESLPSEARPLVDAFNRTLDRVAVAYEAEKRFTADAAHALRTPLTVLDLRLQRAEAGGRIDWPLVRADLAELARVVSGLLKLARAERGRREESQELVNLARVVREAAAALAPALERDSREIEVLAPDRPLMLRGDPGALRDLVAALLDNALIHGAGRITAEVRAEPGAAVLSVRDEGEGVAPEVQEAVFERFCKLDTTSTGAGLGLATVRQAARNHGGDAHFVGCSHVEVRLAA